MDSSILNITFDCADARAQASFWAAVTGWTAQERDATPGHVEYAVEPPAPGGPRLYFTSVPEGRWNEATTGSCRTSAQVAGCGGRA